MRTIHKFQLEMAQHQELPMPKGAKILTVQVQSYVPCIWAEVPADSSVEMEQRTIAMFGTGHPIPFDDYTKEVYIGTLTDEGGTFIFHVYDTTENK